MKNFIYPKILGRFVTREEIIEALRENRSQLNNLIRKHVDSTHRRWPDYDMILDYIDQHGLPPKETSIIVDAFECPTCQTTHYDCNGVCPNQNI